MTKNEIEVEELLHALETIRVEQYPEIPVKLIKDIVLTQFEHQDDRAQGHRDTKKLLDDYLKDIVAEAE